MNAKAAEANLEAYCQYHLKLLGNANARLQFWQETKTWMDTETSTCDGMRIDPWIYQNRILFDALVYLLDELARHAENVADGVKVSFIVDMREWDWDIMKSLMHAIDHSFLISVQKFVIVEPSSIFTTLIATKKSVLNVRVNFPSYSGGEAPEYDAIAFIKEQYRNEGYIYSELDEIEVSLDKVKRRRGSSEKGSVSSKISNEINQQKV
ncbi:hypothetical protein BC830DRAFT_1221115 [Chytriomyces sp. MP71]|nr:hypothetical protein BC830DRAFT_1221115 [Chytriomyces sp. MP71]